MARIGILGAAGYTGGELLRLLVNHPEAEIVFANSESNAGRPVTSVHGGLLGDTDLVFSDALPLGDVDIAFLCFGHGKSAAFMEGHEIPEGLRIIDLAQDFRIEASGNGFVYGLPELNHARIAGARRVANPGCFATCIQLALLPAARMGLLHGTVTVNAITGSTGAGQKPSETTHFSWRDSNLSVYKPFCHQHLAEIRQGLGQAQGTLDAEIDFIPYRGGFARGIFATCVFRSDAPQEEIVRGYMDSYHGAAFTHCVDRPIDLKQAVNTNKCLVHCEKHGDRVLVTSCIDNLLKGAAGQAVQNMNIMLGLNERTGLRLKASAF